MKDLQRYGSIKVRAWDPFLAQCLFLDVYMTPRQGGKDTPMPPGTFLYTYDRPIYDVTSGCKVTVLFWREAPRWTPTLVDAHNLRRSNFLGEGRSLEDARGRKGEEAPAGETLVFHLRPQINNATALHQLTKN